MDLLKELQDVKLAVQDALDDGRISLREAIKILREAADVAAIVMPLILGEGAKAEIKAQTEKG